MPPNAYKPFGTGARACIGRQFAIQEALLVLGMLVQRFEFVDHLHYQLKTKTTLTIKPDDFHIQVRPRAGGASIEPTGRHLRPQRRGRRRRRAPRPRRTVARHGTPLSVLFGSNLGTAESIATRLAQEGTERGFDVTLGALDDHVDDLPHGGAVLIVCSSYNGTPPGQRRRLLPLDRGAAATVRPTASPTRSSAAATPSGPRTYQAVPTLLDEQLAAHGGRRVRARGEGNAAGDFDAAYRAWHGGLWAELATALDLPAEVARPRRPTGPRLSITLTNRQVTNPVIVSYEARPAHGAREPRADRGRDGKPPERSTRHIEIALPGRRRLPRRATTWACCRATASTSSGG